MTTLYFLGGEAPAWRKVLEQNAVEHVGVSFWGLKSRLPKKKPYVLSERFPDTMSIFLDSGAFGAKKRAGDDLGAFQAQYFGFVQANLDRIDFASEFNLGSERDIEHARKAFWETLPEDKVLVIWDPDTGIKGLQSLCERFYRVGVTEHALKAETSLRGRMYSLSQRYGIKWHGVGFSSAELLSTVPLSTAASTSWISPMRYGETQVWDGRKLHRYPASMKDQARKRHRMTFVRAGFDAGKIEADDKDELARLSIWSWRSLEDTLSTRKVKRRDPRYNPFSNAPEEVVTSLEDDEDGFAEIDDSGITTTPAETRDSEVDRAPAIPATPRLDRRPLPVFHVKTETQEVRDNQGNITSSEERMSMSPRGASLRRCDSCYVSASCPAFTPGAECAFDFPVSIQGKDELLSVLRSMVEMQTQRVAFMRYAEELEGGGYADPNLSNEIERLFRMTTMLKEIEDTRDYTRITLESKGSAGRLSRLFGDHESLSAPPEPPALTVGAPETDRLALSFLEGEVVEG